MKMFEAHSGQWLKPALNLLYNYTKWLAYTLLTCIMSAFFPPLLLCKRPKPPHSLATNFIEVQSLLSCSSLQQVCCVHVFSRKFPTVRLVLIARTVINQLDLNRQWCIQSLYKGFGLNLYFIYLERGNMFSRVISLYPYVFDLYPLAVLQTQGQ